MHWLPRLAGLGIILGLIGWSLHYSLQALAPGDVDNPIESILDDERATDDEVVASSEDGSDPEYLAFVGGIPSGRYSVADLPDSRDWDYGERGGREPEPSHISPDNPVADRITVVDNDFVSTPDSESEGDGEDVLPAIVPGLYATEFGVVDCEYELRRIMDNNRDHVIGHDRIEGGRMLVSINEIEPDSFVATRSCGEWSPWSPLTEPLTVAGTGDYWIGDLAEGIWSVPDGCYYEKVVSFRGALFLDVEETGVGPEPLIIDQFNLGIRVRHCDGSPMTWSTDLPPAPPIEDLEAAREAAHRSPVRTDPEISGYRYRRRR